MAGDFHYHEGVGRRVITRWKEDAMRLWQVRDPHLAESVPNKVSVKC